MSRLIDIGVLFFVMECLTAGALHGPLAALMVLVVAGGIACFGRAQWLSEQRELRNEIK